MTPFNAADEGAVASREEKEKLVLLQEHEDLRDILNTPAGVRFFRGMLRDGGMFRSSFTGNSRTFFLEGERNFVLRLLAKIEQVAPQKVAEVLTNPQETKDQTGKESEL